MNRDDNCQSRCSQGVCSRPVVVQDVARFGKTSAHGSHLHIHLIEKALLAGVSAVLFAVAAPCQTTSFASVLPSADTCSAAAPSFQVSALRMQTSPEGDRASGVTQGPGQPHGFMRRTLRRGLQDQKELYAAPFKPSNI